jgi:hypothetical protein
MEKRKLPYVVFLLLFVQRTDECITQWSKAINIWGLYSVPYLRNGMPITILQTRKSRRSSQKGEAKGDGVNGERASGLKQQISGKNISLEVGQPTHLRMIFES